MMLLFDERGKVAGEGKVKMISPLPWQEIVTKTKYPVEIPIIGKLDTCMHTNGGYRNLFHGSSKNSYLQFLLFQPFTRMQAASAPLTLKFLLWKSNLRVCIGLFGCGMARYMVIKQAPDCNLIFLTKIHMCG